MRAYPATLTPDPDGGFTVTFRDVPEAITEGDSREEALLRAEDALESALAMYIAAKEPLPAPSKAEAGEEMVPLSALGWRRPPFTRQCASKVWAAPNWRAGCSGICPKSTASSTRAMPRAWNKSKPPSPPSACGSSST
jgi:predicted RNase H-like HicB family nuclease